ncbi:type 4a pilus biogenesis protein PilO [Bacterioplanoides sp.]|uniref:type 4a pilus biogenesis protein PilO n=1 Tax=Bacterioplanoides sp. TaxID=2066072 RepID=UPI003B001B48
MAGFKDIDWNALKEKISEIELDDINNIAWDNMGGWPLPGKVFFAVLVFVALLIAGNIFLITDMRTSLASAVAKEEKLKADFERKAFRGANLDAYKEQMIEMEQSFGSLLKQLPRETEVPGLIDDISSAALGSGLSLNGIDPQAIISTEFYNELPIEIEVEGGYHEMGSFVSAVASLPRIVTLHDFTIKEGSDNGRLIMQILAKTYQYSSDEEGR